jgi:hypothetical protein
MNGSSLSFKPTLVNEGTTPKVRTTPSWPRSWANFSLLWLYSHRNAWANLHLLVQPNTLLAAGECQIDIVYL